MDTTDKLLSERGTTHGNFDDNAQVAQDIKRIIRNALKANLRPCQHEALDMIAHKIGRIVGGSADFKDHWDDIAGYARLVSDRLTNPAPTPIAELKARFDRVVDSRFGDPE